MFNIIFLAVAVPIMIAEYLINKNIEKKIFYEEPTYLINAHNKKKRAILRTDNERLRIAYWKVRALDFTWLPGLLIVVLNLRFFRKLFRLDYFGNRRGSNNFFSFDATSAPDRIQQIDEKF